MKIMNIHNIQGFFNEVSKCEGKVELVTPYGDCLNLKSNLCKYIALAEVFSGGDIDEIELRCEKRADSLRLLKYVMMA